MCLIVSLPFVDTHVLSSATSEVLQLSEILVLLTSEYNPESLIVEVCVKFEGGCAIWTERAFQNFGLQILGNHDIHTVKRKRLRYFFSPCPLQDENGGSFKKIFDDFLDFGVHLRPGYASIVPLESFQKVGLRHGRLRVSGIVHDCEVSLKQEGGTQDCQCYDSNVPSPPSLSYLKARATHDSILPTLPSLNFFRPNGPRT